MILPNPPQIRRLLPVAENPVFEWRYLRYWNRRSLPAPFEGNNVRFYAYARYGLYLALRSMRAQPGQEVLLPELICDVVLAPLNVLQLRPVYYPISVSLQIDLEKLQDLVSRRTLAVLAVNYMGFAQDYAGLQALCRRHGIWLIEDNVPGLFSATTQKPLGSFGDVALLSLRKSLALPDGAAVVINNPELMEALAPIDSLQHPCALPSRYVIRNLVRMSQRRIGFRHVRHESNPDPGEEPGSDLDLAHYSQPIASFALTILRSVDIDHFCHVRRAAFAFWQRYFADRYPSMSQVRAELPEGAVPFGFAFRGREASGVITELRRQGIEAYWWPTLPRELARRPDLKLAVIPTHTMP